jgi:predicted RNA-binding Zn-ribbon protein involved in translation (DUF1610 family)
MNPVQAVSQYLKVCPVCGGLIRPSEIPVQNRNNFPCPSCGEWLMYDTSRMPVIGIVSFHVAIIAAWTLGYRDTTFVLIVLTTTLLLCVFSAFLGGILIPPQIKRFKRVVWFTYDNRYSPAIWAGSFVVAIVISFSLGFFDAVSLDHYAMFVFVELYITYLVGFLGNFLVGVLIPLPPNQAKGETFNCAGSLHLNDKADTDKKTDA